MTRPVISATGLYTPPHSVSNEELVASLNAWTDNWNAEHAADISAGKAEPRQHSSVEFIEKASGIKSRFVVEKSGVLDPEVMRPHIPERPNEQISILAEIAVNAAKEALAKAGRSGRDIDARHLRLLQPAARLSGDGDRGAGRARRAGLRLRHERRLLVGDVRHPDRRRHRPRRPRALGAGGEPGNLLRPSQLPRPRQPFHLRRRRDRGAGRARTTSRRRAPGRSSARS